jgi:hypothetical protein
MTARLPVLLSALVVTLLLAANAVAADAVAPGTAAGNPAGANAVAPKAATPNAATPNAATADTATHNVAMGNAVRIVPPAPAPPFLSVRYKLTGNTEADIIKDASTRAVLSAAGRLYFTQYMVMAPELLEAYLVKNAETFARPKIYVSEVRGGQRYGDIGVIVNVGKLYDDLVDKKFLYRPAYRPTFYAFLAETLDGAPVTVPSGRLALLGGINDRKYLYLWDEKPLRATDPRIPVTEKKEVMTHGFASTSDASGDLAPASREAQRNLVEVFVTGSIESKTVNTQKVYFDNYTFVQTRAILELVRSDTREVLAKSETAVEVGNADPKEALRLASERAVRDACPALFAPYDQQWGKTILCDKDWGMPELRKTNLQRVLVVGGDSKMLDTVRSVLQSVSPGAEVYTHASFADTAVFSVSWNGVTEDLKNLLHDTPFPGYRMRHVEPDGFVLEVY